MSYLFDQYEIKLNRDTIEIPNSIIRISDIAGLKMVKSEAEKENFDEKDPNTYLLPIFSIGLWFGVVFFKPILGKLFLLVGAFGATVGWITFRMAINKYRYYNNNLPSYNCIKLFFKSERESEVIDIFDKVRQNYMKNNQTEIKGFLNKIVAEETAWIVNATLYQISSIINKNDSIVEEIYSKIKGNM